MPHSHPLVILYRLFLASSRTIHATAFLGQEIDVKTVARRCINACYMPVSLKPHTDIQRVKKRIT